MGWKNSQPGLGTASIHKCMDASSLRCRKLAKKGRVGEYSPLRIPLPSFLRSYEPTHRLFSGRLPPQTCQKVGTGNIPLGESSPIFFEKLAANTKSFIT